jgi:hypothetical protein
MLMFLTLSLPAQESGNPDRSGEGPSLELLEYIGGMAEEENGELIDPMDLPAAEPKLPPRPETPLPIPSAREKSLTP